MESQVSKSGRFFPSKKSKNLLGFFSDWVKLMGLKTRSSFILKTNDTSRIPTNPAKIYLDLFGPAFGPCHEQRHRAVTTYYWDITNGTVSGAGGGAIAPTGSWEGTNWATSSGGTSITGNWVEGKFSSYFCAGSSATGVYTVTANANHTVTGFYNATLGTTIINGSGILSLDYADGLEAGFLVKKSLTISNVLADSGGPCQIETEVESAAQPCLLRRNIPTAAARFWGNYSGNGGYVYFGNNSAFGTGLIQMQANGGTLAAVGSGAYTIGNAVDMANVTLNLIGTPAGVTFTGPWATVSSGTCTLALAGAANDVITISGVMSGDGGFYGIRHGNAGFERRKYLRFDRRDNPGFRRHACFGQCRRRERHRDHAGCGGQLRNAFRQGNNNRDSDQLSGNISATNMVGRNRHADLRCPDVRECRLRLSMGDQCSHRKRRGNRDRLGRAHSLMAA